MKGSKGYTRVASICIAPVGFADGGSIRAPYEEAAAMVKTGRFAFTSKGRWKRDGRHYLGQ